MDDSISELVSDWELKCTITKHYTIHTRYVSDPRTGTWRVPVEEKWRCDQSELGRGSFGVVKLERCISGPNVGSVRAVKQIHKNFGSTSVTTKALSRELSTIMKFSHETYRDCFVQSFGWYNSKNSIYITMEYLPLGDLSKYLEAPLPEAQASRISMQILQGLNFMHEKKFAHRDLKPNNILVQHGAPNWWVKISDFGTSKQIETTVLRTSVGTEQYQAPEVRGIFKPSDTEDGLGENSFSLAVDIWGAGAIAYRIVTGQIAFSKRLELFRYVVQDFPFPEIQSASKDCNEFIRMLMSPSPRQRPSSNQALGFAWLGTPVSGIVDQQAQAPLEDSESHAMSDRDLTEASAEWPLSDVVTGGNTVSNIPSRAVDQANQAADKEKPLSSITHDTSTSLVANASYSSNNATMKLPSGPSSIAASLASSPRTSLIATHDPHSTVSQEVPTVLHNLAYGEAYDAKTFSDDGSKLIVTTDTHIAVLKFTDKDMFEVVNSIPSRREAWLSVSIDPRWTICISTATSIEIWDMMLPKKLQGFQISKNLLDKLVFSTLSQNSTHLVRLLHRRGFPSKQKLEIWDFGENGTLPRIRNLEMRDEEIISVWISPDGNRLILLTKRFHVKLWTRSSFYDNFKERGFNVEATAWAARFSTNNQWLLLIGMAGFTAGFTLWKLDEPSEIPYQLVGTLNIGHDFSYLDIMRVLPDGRVATVGGRGESFITLWKSDGKAGFKESHVIGGPEYHAKRV